MPTNSNKPLYLVTYGGWYQRTTLHLSEIYELFALGRSRLTGLSPEHITELHRQLALTDVSRPATNLEYIFAKSGDIEIKYYEDGLYTLAVSSSDIKTAQSQLEDYFQTKLNPAVSYIFSLGAPTPKVLANIKTVHPTVVLPINPPVNFSVDEKRYGQVYSHVSSENITVFKTPNYIFILARPDQTDLAKDLVNMQIFFREFKDQLEKYLDIHRTVWEEISQIKEEKSLKGKDISLVRSRLDSYQKTINLIKNRINQMGTYLHTRSSLSKALKLETSLSTLFQYKFEVLEDTLNYIKEIWAMTQDYLGSAIQIMVEVESQATNNSIKSLQILTSVGVVSGLLGYMTRNELPRITPAGLEFFGLLVIFTLLVNYLLMLVYKNLSYKLKFKESARI